MIDAQRNLLRAKWELDDCRHGTAVYDVLAEAQSVGLRIADHAGPDIQYALYTGEALYGRHPIATYLRGVYGPGGWSDVALGRGQCGWSVTQCRGTISGLLAPVVQRFIREYEDGWFPLLAAPVVSLLAA